MTVKEFNTKLARFRSSFPNQLQSYIQRNMAVDLTQMIDGRVRGKAQTAEGGRFSTYSKKYLIHKAKEGKLSTGIEKNFEYSSRMWNSFGVKSTTKSKYSAGFVLGGRSTEAQNKIDWNSEREGTNIIEPSKKEIKQLEINAKRFIEKKLNDLLNG